MSTPKPEIAPESELVEEDDEQSLPQPDEIEAAPRPLEDDADSLAAGRDAILRYVKLAPARPGVYRMIDGRGDVLYVGKAKNIKKRVAAYARPTGLDTRIERMVAATRTLEFIVTRTETEALLLEANLIKRLRPRFNVVLRDDKSFPYILITLRPLGAADPETSRRAHAARALLRAVRLGLGGQPHGQRAAARVPAALVQRSVLREPDAAVLLYQIKRCSAPCTKEIDFQDYSALVREANGSCPAARKGSRTSLPRRWKRPRPRSISSVPPSIAIGSAALSAIQSQQGVNPRGVEEADVFAVHQQGGFSCVEVFFFRTGQNWGNRAYFPKADRSLGPAKC